MKYYGTQVSGKEQISFEYDYNKDGSYVYSETYKLPYYFHPFAEKLAIRLWKYKQEKAGNTKYYKKNPNWLAVQAFLYISAMTASMNELLYETSKKIDAKEKGYRKFIVFMKNIKKSIEE